MRKSKTNNLSKMSEEFRKELEGFVKAANPDMSLEETEKMMETIIDCETSGKSPAEVIGMDQEHLDQYYQLAYDHYNTGKYQDARILFDMLISLNPEDGKYLLGLAASYQKMEEYQKAIDYYMALSLIEPENPLPYYYSSDCCAKLGQPIAAAMMLEATVDRCGEEKELEILKTRAQASMEKILADQGLKLPDQTKKKG